MRLTFKVATSGSSGVTRFPMLRHDGEWYCDTNGKLDEAKCRSDMRDTPGITFSNNDYRATISFAVEFLIRIRMTFDAFAKLHPNEVSVTDASVKNADRTASERRMDKGRYAYVRIDIGVSRGGMRIVIGYDNPKNVVGDTENFAAIIAADFAEILVGLRDDILAEVGTAVNIIEGTNCTGLIRQTELTMRYRHCKRRVNGYCTPMDISCTYYKNGKCMYG